MARRHGRAVMPWGEHRGVQLRHLSPGYLSSTMSWMASKPEVKRKFWFLWESLVAEFNHRGLEVEYDAEPEPDRQSADQQTELNFAAAAAPKATRKYKIDEFPEVGP